MATDCCLFRSFPRSIIVWLMGIVVLYPSLPLLAGALSLHVAGIRIIRHDLTLVMLMLAIGQCCVETGQYMQVISALWPGIFALYLRGQDGCSKATQSGWNINQAVSQFGGSLAALDLMRTYECWDTWKPGSNLLTLGQAIGLITVVCNVASSQVKYTNTRTP